MNNKMNTREKFLSVLNFSTNALVPEWEFAYWYDTLQRWYKEGLPKVNLPLKFEAQQWVAGEATGAIKNDVNIYFNFDEGIRVLCPLNPLPAFERKVLQEDSETIILQREDGKVVQTRKDGTSMPHFLEYPVKTEMDFELIKQRFNPDSPERLEGEFYKLVTQNKERKYPIQLGGGNFCGFYSIIREMMGVEASLFVFYDNPEFALSILEYFTDYYIKLYTKILSKIEVDYILIWEDMAFKNGPLISPQIFNEFILPYYKKFINQMKKLGIKHFIVDTDGNFEVLIPSFIEGGVTGFYPFEVQAGIDIER